MFSKISAFILRLWGWKLTGRYPHEIKKLVLAVAPHTSNWDFPLGVLTRSAAKINGVFVAKHTLFQGPFGWIFRNLNGIPVDRTKKGGNFVATVVEAFRERDYLHLVISPEGQRRKVEKFKTGFYHIARQAGVPIQLCTFDWGNMEINFGELFHPTGDETRDLEYLWNYFKGVKGRNPEWGVGNP
jgi:1-acyl-sn-glycerol-3-phosphate acyltransferase